MSIAKSVSDDLLDARIPCTLWVERFLRLGGGRVGLGKMFDRLVAVVFYGTVEFWWV